MIVCLCTNGNKMWRGKNWGEKKEFLKKCPEYVRGHGTKCTSGRLALI